MVNVYNSSRQTPGARSPMQLVFDSERLGSFGNLTAQLQVNQQPGNGVRELSSAERTVCEKDSLVMLCVSHVVSFYQMFLKEILCVSDLLMNDKDTSVTVKGP